IQLPQMKLPEHVIRDYATMSLSLKAHPVQFLRDKLRHLGNIAAYELPAQKNGAFVRVAGLVLVRQRPGTASGVCFITLEDETGQFNLIVWASLFDKYRKEILGAKLLMVEGHLQIEKEVIHVIVQRCHNLNRLLVHLEAGPVEEKEGPVGAGGGNAAAGPDRRAKTVGEPRQASLFPEARNFK